MRLEDIASSNIGLTYSPNDIVEIGIPVFRSNNIKDNKLCLDEVVCVSCEILDNQYLHNGDLLICARNGSRRLVGKNIIISGLTNPTSFGAFMAVCRSQFNPWLKLILDSSYFNDYLDESNSTAINQITQKMLLNFILPIPPIEEQKRILSFYEKFQHTLSLLESHKFNVLNWISSLKSKILELAVTGKLVPQNSDDEPASELLKRINPNAEIITDNGQCQKLPSSWVMCQLGEIFNHNTGKALNSSNQEGELLEYITTSNVYWTHFEISGLKSMRFKASEIEKCRVSKGDLLVCEGGDIGRSAIWNYDRDVMIQNHIHRLRSIQNCASHKLYCYMLMLYKNKDMIGGKGIGLMGLSSNALHQLVIPLPPREEQDRIVAKIEELFSVLDAIKEALQA